MFGTQESDASSYRSGGLSIPTRATADTADPMARGLSPENRLATLSL